MSSYRLVVDAEGDRERTVFASVCERKPRRVSEPVWRSVHDFCNQSQGTDNPKKLSVELWGVDLLWPSLACSWHRVNTLTAVFLYNSCRSPSL